MTEQEKREKAIEEYREKVKEGNAIEELALELCPVTTCCNCKKLNMLGVHTYDRWEVCTYFQMAKKVFELHYRKADEVRKDTAQKIWDELFAGSILMMLARCDYNAEYNEMADEIRRVFKKFGTNIAKIDQ